jgi:tetratricopeptide (TPR) repeat protein
MLDHYRSWLAKKPDDRMALYGVAFELKKAGRVEEAIEAFETLLAKHPTSGAGWFQFGQLFEEDDEEDQALATWRRGLAALEGATDDNSVRSRAEIEGAIAALE